MKKIFNKILGSMLAVFMAAGTAFAIGANVGKPVEVHAAASYSFTGDTIVFADQGLENSVQYTSAFTNGVTSITFSGGANDGKYYTTGSGMRTYGGGSITISSTSTMSKLEFTWDGSNKPTSDVANPTGYESSSNYWAGLSDSVVLTRPSGSGHWRLQQIKITLGSAPAHTHSWDEGTVTTAPTCTEEGVMTYHCSGCDETKTEAIPATGHSYVNGICEHCGAEQPTYFTILPSDGESATQADFTINKLPFTVSVIESTLADEIRVFKGKTITISGVTFKKIVFTCTANGTTKYGPGCWGDGAPSGYTYDGKIGTWEGSASSLSFTATDNQVRITEIDIYITAGGYAQVFTDAIVCDSTGSTAPTFTAGYSWSTLGSIYATLDLTEKGSLKNASASEGGTSVEQAMARYDYIVAKYAYENFIGRSITPIANSRIMFNNIISDSMLIPLIVIIAVISTSFIGAYISIKKKKQD